MSARCSARVSSSTERRETTMLPRRRSILRIWKGSCWCISGPTSRTGRMSTWRTGQERDGAVEIDREAALDLVEDDARDLLALLVQALEAGPAFLAASLVARQNRFTERILDALQVDFDGVADLDVARLAADDRIPSGPRGLPS